LVYSDQIGVDHTAGEEPPQDFVPVLADAELREGELRRVQAGGARVLLTRVDGQVYAIGEVCSHLGGPLVEGKLEGDVVRCPWHGSEFSVRDGCVVNGPAVHPEPRYESRIQNGQIEVRLAPR
jgi:nitrite reductase/ring-hydroxylating ferredoxin subunit